MLLHDPGLRGIRSRSERGADVLPELPGMLSNLWSRSSGNSSKRLETARSFFRPENGFMAQGAGDTDVYKLFCERYRHLVRQGGHIGVVLPRSAFQTAGARGFRRWLFSEAPPERVDFLLNNRRWAFDIHPQFTIALLAAAHRAPARNAMLTMTGPSASRQAFENRSDVRIPVCDTRCGIHGAAAAGSGPGGYSGQAAAGCTD